MPFQRKATNKRKAIKLPKVQPKSTRLERLTTGASITPAEKKAIKRSSRRQITGAAITPAESSALKRKRARRKK